MKKTKSVFFGSDVLDSIRKNTEQNPTAKDTILANASKWLSMTDDELWNLVFTPVLKRAYHVLSDGYCPSCSSKVPLFNWIVNVWDHPWKVRCPECKELFPKNDFYEFYRSGLDEKGLFDYSIANKSLLVNKEPMQNDKFGVDNGTGFKDGDNTWMFIAYYLLWGQWTELIFKGIKNLAKAYVISCDAVYAKKAGILLDRLADVFPGYDFMNQGIMYDKEKVDHGYISYWFVSCLDVRDLAIAYDQIFDEIKVNEDLINFLHEKSVRIGSSCLKNTFSDIQSNIENGIFLDAINNPQKIKSNEPQSDITKCMVKTVLNWPDNKNEIYESLTKITEKTGAVDGTTGEKGLVVYSSHAVWGYANLLWYYENMQPGFIKDILTKYPVIKESFRFFIDTWCLQKYYPRIGDTGAFAQPDYEYAVLYYSKQYYKHSYLDPCTESVLWKIYEATGECDFAKIIYISNGFNHTDSFEKDVTIKDRIQTENMLYDIILKYGTDLNQKSVNKEQWRLALLHCGYEKHKRVLWINYDSGGYHGHYDALNIGLFAKGIELLPDFGYPPVHLGWNYGNNPKMKWYRSTAAHNTVVVDEKNHNGHRNFLSDRGVTGLWAIGKDCQAVTVSCVEAVNEERFERTLVLMNISDEDFYFIDLFRVAGGSGHEKYIHGTFGKIYEHNLNLNPTEKYQHDMCMRNFNTDKNPKNNWYMIWQADDSFYRTKENNTPVFLKYTDVTGACEVSTAESWVDVWRGAKNPNQTSKMEDWIPSLQITRKGSVGLKSTFTGVFEPYESESKIENISKLSLLQQSGNLLCENNIALEIRLKNRYKDIIILTDHEQLNKQYGSADVVLPELNIKTDAQICILRTVDKLATRIFIANGSYIISEKVTLILNDHTDLLELEISGQNINVISGNHSGIKVFKRY